MKLSRYLPGSPADRWLAAYESILSPLGPGVYELIVHLAYDDDEMRGATSDHPDWGAAWRQRDLDMVKSVEFRQFLKDQKFVLVGWRDLREDCGGSRSRFEIARLKGLQKNNVEAVGLVSTVRGSGWVFRGVNALGMYPPAAAGRCY